MKTIFFLLLLLPALVQAQSDSTDIQSDTIKWSAEEFLDIAKNSTVNHESYFVSRGNTSVQWFQDNGAFLTTFSVTQVEGAWEDLTDSGSIVYHATFNSLPGKLTFARDGDWITIRMEFAGVQGGDLNYLYTVSAFENQ